MYLNELLLIRVLEVFPRRQENCFVLITPFHNKYRIFYRECLGERQKYVVFILFQMLQACSVQHLPVPYAAFPPLISSDPFLLHPPHISPHHPPHLPPPGQFVPFQAQQSRSVSNASYPPLRRIAGAEWEIVLVCD